MTENAIDGEAINHETDNHNTMSKTIDANDDSTEPTNDWHTLPGMLGNAIIEDAPTQHHSGGYAVTKAENGIVTIYRVLEMAGDVDELETEGDALLEWYDYVSGNAEVATIEPPEGGWGEEIEELPDDIWGGFD